MINRITECLCSRVKDSRPISIIQDALLNFNGMRRFVRLFYSRGESFENLSFAINRIDRLLVAVFDVLFTGEISIGMNLPRVNRSLSLSPGWIAGRFANGTSVYLAGDGAMRATRMHVSALYHSPPRLECMHLSLAEVSTAERGGRVRATRVISSFVTDDRSVRAEASRETYV